MPASTEPTTKARNAGVTWSDLAVAAATFALLSVTAWLTSRRAGEPPVTVAALLVLACGSLPLVVRRHHPILVWFVAGTSAAIYGLAEWADPLVPAAAFVALVAIFQYCQRRTALIILVISAAAAVVATATAPDPDALDWGINVMTLVVAPVVGDLLRDRQSKLLQLEARNEWMQREQQRAVDEARLLERRQVARELHDVVTHHVTMLVVQAEAAASTREMADADRIMTFDALASTGRDALVELRQLLAVLRDPGEGAPGAPLPGIGQIGELVAGTQATGLAVDYHVPDALGRVPSAVDLAAYRVVQEGLTNVVKHARAERAIVTIALHGDGIDIAVTDDGDGESGVDGVGLTGLRERVGLLGGTVEAAPQPLSGFRLAARIPLRATPGTAT